MLTYLNTLVKQVEGKFGTKYVFAHVLKEGHWYDVTPGGVRDIGGLIPAKLCAGLVSPLAPPGSTF